MTILVAYASRFGSTRGVAEAIGKTLAAQGLAVAVRPVTEAGDISGYDAVALGSAIQGGRPLPEAVAFVQEYREQLARMPVAYFAVCALLGSPTEENRKTAATYLDALREIVPPASTAEFAGMVDIGKMPWLLGLVMKLMARFLKTPPGDYRDWNAIRSWAETLPAVFRASPAKAG